MSFSVSQKRSAGKPSEEGSLLLISLILLGVIALSAIYLSIVLLNEIRSTRYADNAIAACYVAESGAEDALWRLQVARREGDTTFFDAHVGEPRCAAEGGTGNIGCLSSTPEAGTDPERIFDFEKLDTSGAEYTAYDIPRNSTVSFDIFDPAFDPAMDSTIATNISNIYVDWYVDDCSGDQTSAKLELSYTPIGYYNNPLQFGEPTTIVDTCNCSTQDSSTGFYECRYSIDPQNHWRSFSINEEFFHRVSLRSLDTAVKQVIVTVGDAGGDPVLIPSLIELQANGTFREAYASVNLRTSWQTPPSSLFNYVIFSQESLIKATQGSGNSPYTSRCGFCTVSNSPCSSSAECSAGNTCTIVNDMIDAVDGGDSQAFCKDRISCIDDGDCGGGLCADGYCVGVVGEEWSAAEIYQTGTGFCNAFCNGYSICGDGIIQSPNGAGIYGTDGTGNFDPMTGTGLGYEECDDGFGGNSDTLSTLTNPSICRTSCLYAYCGDGVVDAGEACDDGNTDSADTCDVRADNLNGGGECTLTFCGDDTIQEPNGVNQFETCDDGVLNGSEGQCNLNCDGSVPSGG